MTKQETTLKAFKAIEGSKRILSDAIVCVWYSGHTSLNCLPLCRAEHTVTRFYVVTLQLVIIVIALEILDKILRVPVFKTIRRMLMFAQRARYRVCVSALVASASQPDRSAWDRIGGSGSIC